MRPSGGDVLQASEHEVATASTGAVIVCVPKGERFAFFRSPPHHIHRRNPASTAQRLGNEFYF